MEYVLFDALKDKSPKGAVRTNSPVLFSVKVSNTIEVSSFCMVLRGIDEAIGKRYYFTKSTVYADYTTYKTDITLQERGIYYYRFECDTPNGIKFIGKDELNRAVIKDFLPEWQLTVCDQNFVVPEARRGNITYQIFVDRFNKGGNIPFNNHVGVLKKWDEPLTIVDSDGVYRANDFYGGNLKGITEKLDYIASLGVKNIYLSPIFEASSNHRYDTADYLKIDSLIGDEKDFKELISKAKNLGIGVMLDGVFNHTGADSVYFNKFGRYDSVGAYQSKQSKYYDWYTFTNFPDKYECWWGVTVVPTVTNKQAESFQDLIFNQVLDKWTKFDISGWRLDVADELPIWFLDKLRVKVKSVNKDAVIIGEVWEDASTKVSYSERRPYLLGSQLDGVMNYPFKDAITAYLLDGLVMPFWKIVLEIINNYPKEVLDVSLSLLDSHDTYRIINSLSKVDTSNMTKAERQNYVFSPAQYENAKKLLKLGVVLQYTLMGSPTVFYGDEQGITGWDDPLSRPTFRLKDDELYNIYVKIGKIHNDYIDCFTGSFDYTFDENLIIFDRVQENAVKTVINNSGLDQTYEIEYDCCELLSDITYKKYEKVIMSNSTALLLKKL